MCTNIKMKENHSHKIHYKYDSYLISNVKFKTPSKVFVTYVNLCILILQILLYYYCHIF